MLWLYELSIPVSARRHCRQLQWLQLLQSQKAVNVKSFHDLAGTGYYIRTKQAGTSLPNITHSRPSSQVCCSNFVVLPAVTLASPHIFPISMQCCETCESWQGHLVKLLIQLCQAFLRCMWATRKPPQNHGICSFHLLWGSRHFGSAAVEEKRRVHCFRQLNSWVWKNGAIPANCVLGKCFAYWMDGDSLGSSKLANSSGSDANLFVMLLTLEVLSRSNMNSLSRLNPPWKLQKDHGISISTWCDAYLIRDFGNPRQFQSAWAEIFTRKKP